MDVSVVVMGVVAVAAVLVRLFLPRPRFVRALAEYDLPEPGTPPHTPPGRVRFSLLVAARHEPDLAATVGSLLALPRRDAEILLLLAPGDFVSEPAARDLARRHPERIRVVHSPAVTKSVALNAALPHCAGEIIGVIDVEGPVRGNLLDRVDGAVRASGADVVRVATDIPDGTNAIELQKRLDRLVCVRGSRPVRVAKHFYLGPSDTHFVRTELVRLLGGWDDDCKAEEQELMLRLFSYGASGVVLYGEPARETGTPVTRWGQLTSWRVRHFTSALQIHRTGEWRRSASLRDRATARQALVVPLIRALAAGPVSVLAVAVAGVLANGYVAAAMAVWCLALLHGPAVEATLWSRAQPSGRWQLRLLLAKDRQDVPLVTRVLVTRLPDLALLTWSAWTALRRYLRSDTKVLRSHFERSLDKPPRPPVAPPPDRPTPQDSPADLLHMAESTDTPAAVTAMASGLDALFRALGPPPSSLRLAEAGPAPQGDGGASDG
ncbi:glycosyltransferase [Streptomyces sp. NPDC056632]|uniref:glycosyltransferase n=1 Tax=Streptomyces sp. NPDC056632 TaxID=3345884 RepID=UPI00369C145C